MIAGARRAVAFTGAGISTESGVPDFRSPGSPWMKHHPIPFDQYMASRDARAEAWRRKFTMDDLYAGAQPSIGHRVLAGMVADGRMQAIITQNIDGLHQASGVPADKVIELHGNGTYATCLDCGVRHELRAVRARFEAEAVAPDCGDCGGIVKSATISFGQAMPVDAMRRAEALARDCDLFLVLGSSLVVFPAANLPRIARRSGARLVIINREPTDLDEAAPAVVRGSIGPVLEPLLQSDVEG
ncbi:MAG: SIR2 family NAD-dependent protein deacylase [Beijerinckiaceae bacterium]